MLKQYMPNYCSNRIIITGDLTNFKKTLNKLGRQDLLKVLLPK